MALTISILIPFRAEPGSWRDKLRVVTASMWRGVDVEVCYGTDGRAEGEPWNCSRALNDARSRADGDILWTMGADHVPPSYAVLEEVRADLEVLPWREVWAHTHELHEDATRKLVSGTSLARLWRHCSLAAESCMGITAVRAEVWDDLGGMDERFDGWGFEDTALRCALASLYPQGRTVGEGAVLTLWHPRPADQWEGTGPNADLYAEYVAAAEAGEMRAYLEGVHGGGQPVYP